MMILYTPVTCRTICGPVQVPSQVSQLPSGTYWPFADCRQCGRSYVWDGTQWFGDRALKDAPRPSVFTERVAVPMT